MSICNVNCVACICGNDIGKIVNRKINTNKLKTK